MANVKSMRERVERLQSETKGTRLPKGCKTKEQWMARLRSEGELWRACNVRGEISHDEYCKRVAALGPLFPEPTPEEREMWTQLGRELREAAKRAEKAEAQRQRDIAEYYGKRRAEETSVAGEEERPVKRRALVERIEDETPQQKQPTQAPVDRLAPYRGNPDAEDAGEIYFEPGI